MISRSVLRPSITLYNMRNITWDGNNESECDNDAFL
jgi:hypothetical protein